MHFVSSLSLLFYLFLPIWSRPYGGWGPNEGFGQTGSNPPPPNPNSIYGYDFHNIYGDLTTYGAIYNPHRNRLDFTVQLALYDSLVIRSNFKNRKALFSLLRIYTFMTQFHYDFMSQNIRGQNYCTFLLQNIF